MKHKDFKDRAELLEAASASIRMQEKAGIEPVCKLTRGDIGIDKIMYLLFTDEGFPYEFPLGVVEDKAVFEGDELYWPNGEKAIVNDGWGIHSDWDILSWNPPKPKTVMVELLTEDAEYWNTLGEFHHAKNWANSEDQYLSTSSRFYSACKKALEKK